MVKIERTNGENAKIAIASLEKEKQKKNGNYNASEIFDAINENGGALIRFYQFEL